jgi:hypothetical protein
MRMTLLTLLAISAGSFGGHYSRNGEVEIVVCGQGECDVAWGSGISSQH